MTAYLMVLEYYNDKLPNQSLNLTEKPRWFSRVCRHAPNLSITAKSLLHYFAPGYQDVMSQI